jgi:hypothetical protein
VPASAARPGRAQAEEATAFGNRQATHAITIDAAWRPGEDFGERDAAWSRAFFAALDRFREGVYINSFDADEGPARVCKVSRTSRRTPAWR